MGLAYAISCIVGPMPSDSASGVPMGHQPAASHLPLAGVRVVDLTHHVAGPYCTKWLATLGADVIKIERPGSGDIARSLPPFPADGPHLEKSGLFLYLNTGKRSVTLDLRSASGRDALLDLVGGSAVVVENFRPGVLAKLGLGYETLATVNPAVVLTSISNFGQTGPYRDLQATEIVLFGMGGLMSVMGFEDSPPLKFGGYQSLYMGGMSALTATLTALRQAEATGSGHHVDVSLFESMVSSSFQSMVEYEYTGRVQHRSRAMFVFPCRDGYVGLNCQDHQWRRLVKVLGIPELDSAEFANQRDRRVNYEALEAAILPWTLERAKQEIYDLGQAAGLPFSYFGTIDDLLTSPQYKAREFFKRLDHPVAGAYEYPGSPIRFDGVQPTEQRAPLLGEHDEDVLRSPTLGRGAR